MMNEEQHTPPPDDSAPDAPTAPGGDQKSNGTSETACDTPVSPRFCPRCGLPTGAEFCGRCGHRFCLTCGDG